MKKELKKLTESDIKQKGVQALSNTPARRSSYGESGLTPQQIKEKLDRLPAYIGELLNGVIDALQGDDFGDYVSVMLHGENTTLSNLMTMIENGLFSGKLGLSIDGELRSLAFWINAIYKFIMDESEKLKTMQENITNGALADTLTVDLDGGETVLQSALDKLDQRLKQTEALTDALDAVLDEILSEQVAIINIIKGTEGN